MSPGVVVSPDLEEVSRLMRRVWAPPCWDYTRDFLSAWIEKPSGLPELSIALERDGSLIAYEAMVPYELRVHGERHRLLQTGFWTADAARGGPAAAWSVYREVVARARDSGISGFLTTLEKGASSEAMFELSSARMGLDLRVLGEFPQLFAMPRSLQRKLASSSSSLPARACVRPYEAADEDATLALLEQTRSLVDLNRVLPREDADYVLRTRPYSRTWLLEESGEVKALAKSFEVGVVRQKGRARTIILDLSARDDLPSEVRQAFVARMLEDDVWKEISMITVACPDTFGRELLRELGFLPTKQAMRLYFAPFQEGFELAPVKSFRLDLL